MFLTLYRFFESFDRFNVFNIFRMCKRCRKNTDNTDNTDNSRKNVVETTFTVSTTDVYQFSPPLTEEQKVQIQTELINSVSSNSYDKVLKLLEIGAEPLDGIRIAKSPNILSLLYRFENERRVVRKNI